MKHIIKLSDTREVFDKLNNYYGALGLNPEFSQIRIETPLINGQGTYDINIKKENLDVTEQGLRRNDLFIATSLGFYFTFEDPSKKGVESLISYAKIGAEADATAGTPAVDGFAKDDIQAFYNGTFYLQTGTIVNLEDLPLSLFEKRTQYQDDLQAFDLQSLQVSLAERFVFAGTQDHKLQVSFPSFASSDYSAAIDGKISKLVFIALGYKVAGGTGEKFRVESNPFYAMI